MVAIETSIFAIRTIATGFWIFDNLEAIQTDWTGIVPTPIASELRFKALIPNLDFLAFYRIFLFEEQILFTYLIELFSISGLFYQCLQADY